MKENLTEKHPTGFGKSMIFIAPALAMKRSEHKFNMLIIVPLKALAVSHKHSLAKVMFSSLVNFLSNFSFIVDGYIFRT